MSKFSELRKYAKERKVEKYHRLKTFLEEKKFMGEAFRGMRGILVSVAVCVPLTILGAYCERKHDSVSTNKSYSHNVTYQTDTANNSTFVDTTKNKKSIEYKVQ